MEGKKKLIYLSNLCYGTSKELEVVEPIPITIEEAEDEVIAEFSEVTAYGSGASEPEAVSALKEDIAWLYYDLNSTPDEKLGKAPLAWKRILNKKIRRKVKVTKCPICEVEYKGIDTESGGPWFPPCPNGHTYWEQIAYANEQLRR